MLLAQLTTVLRQLHRLVVRPVEGSGDARLLERFVACRDESAFAELLRRHGPMVLGLCRRLLGHEQDAEDAFQATFLVLARKAGSVRRRQALGGWLYGVASRTATELRRRRARRLDSGGDDLMDQRPGREADPRVAAGARETAGVLDEELGRLPEKYRTALVLCYLEGQTHEEAARQTGVPLGTLKTRVSAGRQLLGRRLRRRGVALSATGLAGLLSEQAATAAVPAFLIQTTAKAAVGFAAGAAAVASSEVGVLAEGVLKTMLLAKVKLAVVLSLVLGLCGAGSAMLWKRPVSSSPPAAPERAEDGKGPRPAKVDQHGDALPTGAVARLGTVRFRHGGGVTFVTFLPDGGRGGATPPLLSVGTDWMARIWDVATGKELRRFDLLAPGSDEEDQPATGVRDEVLQSMAVSADGKTLAARSRGGFVRVWDVETGKERLPIRKVGINAGALAFTPDSKALAVRWYDGTIELWDLAQQKKVRNISGQTVWEKGPVFETLRAGMLAFSPDGKLLAEQTYEYRNREAEAVIRLLDVTTGKELHKIEAPPGARCPVFSPDGRLLAWDHNGAIVLTDVKTGKRVRGFAERGVRFGRPAAFSPDGKYLLGRMPGQAVLRVWEVTTGKSVRTIGTPRPSSLPGLGPPAVSPDGKLAALAGGGNGICLLDLETGKERPSPAGHRSVVGAISFSRDGKTVTTYGRDGAVYRWEAGTGKQTARLRLPVGKEFGASPSPDGRTFALANPPDNEIILWDAAAGKELRRIKRQPFDLWSFVFSPDGKTLAMWVREDTKLRLYDVSTGKERLTLHLPAALGGRFHGLDPLVKRFLLFSPDGRRIAAPGLDRKLHVWDTCTGRDLLQIALPEDRLTCGGTFSPDGRMLALATGDGGVTLWELATGRPRRQYSAGQRGEKEGQDLPASSGITLRRPPGQRRPYLLTGGPCSVAFSPDGRLLALAGPYPLVVVWDVASGKELSRFKGHQGEIESVAFAPDGKTLVTGSSDTTALIWDVTGPRKKKTEADDLPPEVLDRLWADLRSEDAKKAYHAVIRLSAAAARAVPLLKKQLRPVAPADTGQVKRLVADLDSPRFAVRQEAQEKLEKLRRAAAPALKQALEGKPPLETRKRIESLLERAEGTLLHGESLRTVRAIEILERIGTPEARQVLESLAKGAPGAVETDEAATALRRLGR